MPSIRPSPSRNFSIYSHLEPLPSTSHDESSKYVVIVHLRQSMNCIEENNRYHVPTTPSITFTKVSCLYDSPTKHGSYSSPKYVALYEPPTPTKCTFMTFQPGINAYIFKVLVPHHRLMKIHRSLHYKKSYCLWLVLVTT